MYKRKVINYGKHRKHQRAQQNRYEVKDEETYFEQTQQQNTLVYLIIPTLLL